MKYPSQKLVIFAVYRKFIIFGKPARTFEIAFPDLCQAKAWVKDNTSSRHAPESLYMIEEMNARMNAWDIG
jgi:hypothetical protein